MAYSEKLADRIRKLFHEKQCAYEEKKMMGGLCFMVDDKMCMGLLQDKSTGADLLMARIGPEQYDQALQEEGCKPMDFTGRPMKGMVFIEDQAIQDKRSLKRWMDRCLKYNPVANRSKPSKKPKRAAR